MQVSPDIATMQLLRKKRFQGSDFFLECTLSRSDTLGNVMCVMSEV